MKSDVIRGGKGDKAQPSDFDPDQLKMGIKVEMEHTKSRRIAREIAMDHLSEDPRYYTKLRRVHKEHVSTRSAMQSVEELVQLMSSVNSWLNEAAVPPAITPADRAKEGREPLPALKSRKGLVPPPLPLAAKHDVLVRTADRAIVAGQKIPRDDKSKGTKRSWSTFTVPGHEKSPTVALAGKIVNKRIDRAGSDSKLISDGKLSEEIRRLCGESRRVSNQPIIRKPRLMILRPKPLVAAGSKLKAGTSPGRMKF